jgi:hypothetical protein
MASPMPASPLNFSHQYQWTPAAAEFILAAYGRIQIKGRQLTPDHLIDARREANLILSDYSNRGVNLWLVGDADVAIALGPNTAGLPAPGITTPGLEAFPLPIDTADLLDCYLRTFTPNATGINIGNALTPILDFTGNPIVNAPYGDVRLAALTSGVLSTTAGSQYINVNWPSHGLSPLYPIFWGTPIWVGGVMLPLFSIVSSVIDSNNVTIMAPSRAPVSASGFGAPPLFATTAGSATVNCYFPGHNLQVGAQFYVGIPTTVGGITLSGLYTVKSVIANPYGQASYQFTFTAAEQATAVGAAFENAGQIAVTQQAAGSLPTDIFLWPISRNDYSMQPLKDSPGNPSTYWFNRTIIPEVRTWPVAPFPSTPNNGPYLGFVGYRMKDPQVLNPGMGQNVDIPRRFYQAFVAELCAAVAEIWKPAMFAEKKALAEQIWQRAADNDREKVTLSVVPEMGGYFNC